MYRIGMVGKAADVNRLIRELNNVVNVQFAEFRKKIILDFVDAPLKEMLANNGICSIDSVMKRDEQYMRAYTALCAVYGDDMWNKVQKFRQERDENTPYILTEDHIRILPEIYETSQRSLVDLIVLVNTPDDGRFDSPIIHCSVSTDLELSESVLKLYNHIKDLPCEHPSM